MYVSKLNTYFKQILHMSTCMACWCLEAHEVDLEPLRKHTHLNESTIVKRFLKTYAMICPTYWVEDNCANIPEVNYRFALSSTT